MIWGQGHLVYDIGGHGVRWSVVWESVVGGPWFAGPWSMVWKGQVIRWSIVWSHAIRDLEGVSGPWFRFKMNPSPPTRQNKDEGNGQYWLMMVDCLEKGIRFMC